MKALIDVADLMIRTPGGRTLFDGLTLRLGRDRVALIGRNGVGKSTLLRVLAGAVEADSGRVTTRGDSCFVPQELPPGAGSHGERRRRALALARDSGAEIMLLDEPSEDLDDAGVAWLRGWLASSSRCLLVASHDRRLLADFQHFFLASESGCRFFRGTLAELDAELDREHHESEARYAANLRRLAEHEEHALHVARRKARKKRYGRCSELDRATPRIRLNEKRGAAQASHGRLATIRAARLDAHRALTQSARRALAVSLSLELPIPELPPTAQDVVVLRGVTARVGDRCVVESLDLRIRRERIAVVGPNGAGKTTLLEIVAGRRVPAAGSCWRDPERIGVIAQGGADWMLASSLRECLRDVPAAELAAVLLAHRFPLALAERPLCSLSAGERARAALICLFRRAPAIELLVLDEPTYSLDLVGQRAMTNALRAWPGALVVASHDRDFLAAIEPDVFLTLTGFGPDRTGSGALSRSGPRASGVRR